MPEHYTKNTESVTRWCNHCKRHTQFAVSDGRIGRCTEHEAPQFSKAQLKKRDELEARRCNPFLFDPEAKDRP